MVDILSVFGGWIGFLVNTRYGRFIALLQLLREKRLRNEFTAFMQRADRTGFKWHVCVVKIIVVISIFVYVSACLFVYVGTCHQTGNQFCEINCDDAPCNWLEHQYGEEILIHQKDNMSWEKRTEILWKAMYWSTITITTLGYGDVVPMSEIETMYCVLVLLVSTIVLSSVTAELSAFAINSSASSNAFNVHMEGVTEFMKAFNLPSSLRRAIERCIFATTRIEPTHNFIIIIIILSIIITD